MRANWLGLMWLCLMLLISAPTLAAVPSVTNVGGATIEVCIAPTIQTSAYTTGYTLTGSFIPFANAVGTLGTGILQSVRIDIKSAQTAEFDVTFFAGVPSTSLTINTAPGLSSADVLLAYPPIKLTSYYAGLSGTSTVYGFDGIGRAINLAQTTMYALVIVVGTPTFTTTSDFQICVTILRDN